MSGIIQVGAHTLTFEEPDLMFMRVRGEINEQDARLMLAEQKKFSAGKPYVLGLSDISEFAGISPQARKFIAKESATFPFRGGALIGASFQTRIMANLILTAIGLFLRKDNPMHFFETEKEARTWLEERRRVLAREKR